MPNTMNGARTIASLPIADDILALTEDEIPAFFHRQIAERQLSITVRSLNSEILTKEAHRARRAQDALARLGLIFRA